MDENSTDSIPDNTSGGEEEVFVNKGTKDKPDEVLLTANGQKFLNQTRPWVRFLSIMFYILTTFTLLGGLTVLIVTMSGNLFNSENNAFGQLPGGGFELGLLYLVMAILYVPPGIFLSRYASAIKTLESTPASDVLERALKYQKSFWRYVGILTVIVLIITELDSVTSVIGADNFSIDTL